MDKLLNTNFCLISSEEKKNTLQFEFLFIVKKTYFVKLLFLQHFSEVYHGKCEDINWSMLKFFRKI
jgi:hypothetical protein